MHAQSDAPPDIDACVNNKGISIRAVADSAMRHAAAGTGAGSGEPNGAAGPSGQRLQHEGEEDEEDEDEAWRRQLREADSDREDGWGADG